MKNKIFYQAVTQFENTGDLIINRSLVELLKAHADLVVNDIGVPDWYLKDLAVSNKSRLTIQTNFSFTAYLIKQVLINFFNRKERIYLISGPGHFYGDSTSKTIKNFVSGLLFWGLKLLGCRIVKCGTSLGPLSKKIAISEAFRSRFYFKYLIRDTMSMDLANRIGIKNHNYMPDLAWALNAPKKNQNKKKLKNKIFLSFRETVIEDGNSSNYLEKLLKTIDLALASLSRENKFESIVVGYQVDRDYPLCKMLYKRYKEKYHVELLPDRISLNMAEEVYSDVSFVLSNRLHVLLFASKYGALPICITDVDSHLKIKGIFLDSNLEALLVDITKNKDLILKSINHIEQNSTNLLSLINQKDVEYKKQTFELIKNIFN